MYFANSLNQITTTNQILVGAANNTTSSLATAVNGVLVTSAGGVPSIASTLPATVQDNITQVGTITSGVWNGTGIAVANGGTGAATLTGVLIGNGTSAVTGQAITQYDVLVGGATNAISSISPSTSGLVLTSNGVSANPTFQALPSSSPLTITTVAHAASPYTVLSTDVYLAVDTTGGVVSILLPNTTTTGRQIIIKDTKGHSVTAAISVTTVGGTVTIDGATTQTMNVNYFALGVLWDGTTYQIY